VTLTVAVVAQSGTALWYLTRATGLVSLVLLSATVVLGLVASTGWTAPQWPRFLSQAVHRNLSLFCLVFIAIHIVTTVADGFVPIGYLDAFVPFLSPYRPLWVGMGALAFDMLLAIGITSGLRSRIRARSWRGVHYLAYLCWPVAVLHALGTGTDARLPLALLIEVLCIAAVVGAVGWRLAAARGMTGARRATAAGATAVVVIGIVVISVAGPLRSGWSLRAGTSAAVLAQIKAKFAGTAASAASPPSAVPGTTAPVVKGAIPAAPFTDNVTGSIRTSQQAATGEAQVFLTMRLQGSDIPLAVTLIGTVVSGGGVSMTSSSVTFGNENGQVTALDGATIGATVQGPRGQLDLEMQLSINQSQGTISGTVSATSGNGR